MAESFAVFRADGGPTLGGGHIARCLALADELARRGWRCAFAVSAETAATMRALAASAHEVLALPAAIAPGTEPLTMATRWPQGCAVLVADHYHRDAAFESACRPWAARIVAIDDLANRRHDCDLLTDPTLGRKEALYRRAVPQASQLLLGPDYALLRPAFAAARPRALERRRNPALRRVLLSFGGTDPVDATGACLDAIRRFGLDLTLAVDVVLGAAAPRLNNVRRLVAALPQATLHVETESMADLMTEADCALGGAGATSWERCCLGLPALITILADNQLSVAAALGAAGAARIAGPWRHTLADAIMPELAALTPDRLARMAKAAAAICDGSGIFRVADAIERLRASPT